jgi:uncharacterized ferredoxin-like protein
MKISVELEKEAALHVAALMAAAGRTAPKTRGIDNIRIVAIDDDETRQRVVEKMREIAARDNRPSFQRDARSVSTCPAFVVIGVAANPAGLNCGYCGQATCEALKALRGVCAFNSIDLGIAISSAAALASQSHIDNRVMYSIGKACLELGVFGEDVRQALGIPLSVTGKNPFFDRKEAVPVRNPITDTAAIPPR